jgi:4-alpha-glucanotransferase
MKRGSGILLHITSLPSPHGIGDLGPTAYCFADALAQARQSYWQVLPLNPVNPAAGCSPYFSSGGSAGNPLLISPDILVADGLLQHSDCTPPSQFPSAQVDFERVIPWKMKLLDLAYHTFARGHGLTDEFHRFCNDQGAWLNDFAIFSVLKNSFEGRMWGTWPEQYKRREIPELEAVWRSRGELLEKEKFYQFIFNRQWHALKSYCNRKGVLLVGDIPIYVSYDSVDVWANPWIFKLDGTLQPYAVSGVPPDYFSSTGQLWNNPVYRWDALRESRYEWWVQRMKLMFERFDVVRIDHFRGLVQYWEIPSGEQTAINGKWQDVPTYDFFDTLLGKFPNFPVIAEDLGIITDEVREAIRHYGFPGMKILLFAFGEDNARHPYLPCNFNRNCVVYTGTHDNNTCVGWLEHEASPADRERVFRYIGRKTTPVETTRELIRLSTESIADVAIFPMQDILGLDASARMNTPSHLNGNWKWRMTQEQMDAVDFPWLAQMSRAYGR